MAGGTRSKSARERLSWEIDLSFVLPQVVGRKYAAVFGFENDSDAAKRSPSSERLQPQPETANSVPVREACCPSWAPGTMATQREVATALLCRQRQYTLLQSSPGRSATRHSGPAHRQPHLPESGLTLTAE
jgi:hypothetical protein